MIKFKNLFSHRKNLIKVEDNLQTTSLSSESKNIIWSAIVENLLQRIRKQRGRGLDTNLYFYYEDDNKWTRMFFNYFWLRIKKLPIDELEDN